MLYRITTSYACFGIITNQEGIVIRTAPIASWTIGKDVIDVLEYYIRKGALYEEFETT